MIITSLFPVPGSSPFAGSFVVDFLRALQPEADVTVLVPQEIRLAEIFKSGVVRASVKGLDTQFVRYASPLLIFLSTICAFRPYLALRYRKHLVARLLRRASQRLHRQENFTLVHGIELFTGDEAVPIGRALDLPSIVTIHSKFDFLEQLFGPRVLSAVLKNLKYASQITIVSDMARRTYPHDVGARMTIIPNGYQPQQREGLALAIKEFCGDRVVLLYAGYFIPSKHPDFVVRSAADLVTAGFDPAVILIGDGPEQKNIEKYIARHHLSRNVTLMGSISPDRMPALYHRADLILQPSRNESFSMTCLEGMAYGKPFICTSQAGITEYIRHEHEALIVQPDSFPDFTNAVRRLVEDKVLRERLGYNGRRTSNNFSWSAILPRYLSLYQS